MKARRHQRILDIIRVQPVRTQEELADVLAREGISVTQATISRDIKELQLIKAPVGDGTYSTQSRLIAVLRILTSGLGASSVKWQ